MKITKLLLVMLSSITVVACGGGGGGNSSGSGISPNTVVVAGNYRTVRINHTATRLPNGKVLVAGGWGGTIDYLGAVNLASAELYDQATNSWAAASSMATARDSHTATLLPNGKILVAGGVGSGNNNFLASAELYDPATNIWTSASDMTTARFDHTATLLPNGKVLVIGSSSTELYDPTTNIWTAVSNMTTTRSHHTATLLPNGKVLVTGGWGGAAPLSSTEIYDPATNIWTASSSTSIGRDSHTATLLPNGKVLVAGGVGSSGSLSSAELYNPATNSWTTTGSLTTARDSHTATLLSNGKVLVAEGVSSSISGGNLTVNGNLASIELYDPSTNTWTAAGNLTTPNNNTHTATLLPNGKVLFAGESGELYTGAGSGTTTTGTGTEVTFSGNLGGFNSVANTHYANGAYVAGGSTGSVGILYFWIDAGGAKAQLVYDSTNGVIGVNLANSSYGVTCGINSIVNNFPLCSSVGVTFNHTTGAITFASTPIFYYNTTTPTGIIATGSLTFAAF